MKQYLSHSTEETEQIAADFAAGLHSVRQYELLPYHPLGDAKRAAMGQPPAPFTVPPKDIMKEWNTYAFLR